MTYALYILFFPLLAGSIVGIFGKPLRVLPSQLLTTLSVAASFILSTILFYQFIFLNHAPINQVIYSWAIAGQLQLNIGFMIDRLSVMMALVVTFISLLVHIYSFGYMYDDPSKQRFFSYISLFTFMMLALIFANNFLLLFFGWEGVGLMSYLLIGFWFQKDSANAASMKAFLVNRVADFLFLVGIAGVFAYTHSLDFSQAFIAAPSLAQTSITLFGHQASLLTVLCLLIFCGAMGKSAQVPLHVWLPESMEGPTPISALIHAATMVTAGIYLVARLSPMYQLSPTALSVVMIIGATSALFMGILGLVQTDIKRVVAYSTLSQLGYMMAGAGASAYAASIFHLFTHACFKALLFLAAGSVIIALHHEQDMRKMGALAKKLPITYITFLCGALALIALPPTSGFYSKDSIIDAVQQLNAVGSSYTYWCLTLGVFITALYTFRCFFLVFHTPTRVDNLAHVHETSSTMWIPLIILAIPSLALGYFLFKPLMIDSPSWFGTTIITNHAAIQTATAMAIDSLSHLPFWLMLAGVLTAWLCYVRFPTLPTWFATRLSLLYVILVDKYGFDRLNDFVFVKGTRKLSKFFFAIIDVKVIDEGAVNGSGKLIAYLSQWARKLQSGYLYQYVFIMILGLLVLLFWQV
jgi:NADH-quinone oxidoreductase subunit L